MKNDYSKVFAMLRPVKSGLDGMAGFARIEIRSGRGSMSLNAQGIKNTLIDGERYVAVLVAEGGKGAYECGELIPGSRGQGNMLFEFDPQNVGGAPLENYTAAVVALRNGDSVTPLVAGIFGRKGIDDWDAAVAPLFKASETVKAASVLHEEQQSERVAEATDSASDIEVAPADIDGEADEGQDAFAAEDSFASMEKLVKLCAQDLTWQGYAFAMKRLFEEYPVVSPLDDVKDMLFVKINMPVISAGVDHYILGAHAKGDEVDMLCIGVPGAGGIVPPPGLESATWKSDGKGKGYWLTWQDAYMGYPIRREV